MAEEEAPNEEPEGEDPEEKPDLDSLPSWARDQLTKARKEAAGYRTKLRETEPLAQKAKELEEASKTEAQKLAEERDTHRSRADKSEVALLRMEVALDKAPETMSLAQVRKLSKRLSGSTQEELEADAEELFAEFTGKPDDRTRRPKERLRSGTAPDEEPDEDVDKLLARIPR